MDTFVAIVVPTLSVVGALFMLLSAVAMLRAHDALSRINVLSPATGVGLPLIVVAAYIRAVHLQGFEWWGLVQLAVTLVSLLVVSSVASNTLARSAYLSGSPVDPRAAPQDLARAPDEADTRDD